MAKNNIELYKLVLVYKMHDLSTNNMFSEDTKDITLIISNDKFTLYDIEYIVNGIIKRPYHNNHDIKINYKSIYNQIKINFGIDLSGLKLEKCDSKWIPKWTFVERMDNYLHIDKKDNKKDDKKM